MTTRPALDQMHSHYLREFVEAYSSGPSRAFLRSFEADLLAQVPLQPPVLDLACGDGLVSAFTFGRQLDHGCDLMMSQLVKAQARRQYRALVVADVRELPYEDATFGTVVSNSSLEHIPNVEAVLAEAFRVLRPDGLFVFTVPNPRFNDWYWANWLWHRLGKPARGQTSIENFNRLREHHNVYDAGQWRKLLEATGFSQLWSTEYFPFKATFVFSMLEHMWTYDVTVPRIGRGNGSGTRRINLAAGALLLLPKGIRASLQTRILSLFSGQRPGEEGSHLLIVGTR